MKLALMQPYVFPYLGYFQLVHAVDLFVLYDDAAFRKQSWCNRNNLLGSHGAQRFTLPVRRPRMGQPICQVELHDPLRYQQRILRTIDVLYARTRGFKEARPVIEEAVSCQSANLADYAVHSLSVLCRHLGIDTRLTRSSDQYRTLESKGQQRVIEVCRAETATVYINPEGGRHLYDPAAFRRAGMELKFLVHRPRPYPQSLPEFVPRLSIIDVMMWNGLAETRRKLADYEFADSKPERY